MNIVLTQGVRDVCMTPLRISAGVVRDTIVNRDQVETLRFEEGTGYMLFCRRVTRPGDGSEFYTLVVGRPNGESLEVFLAFKIPAEVYANLVPDEITPLGLLRALAENFGVEVSVGNRRAKFIASEQIPGGAQDKLTLMESAQPSDKRPIVQVMSARFVKDADPTYWDCGLAFAIDLTKYKAALGV